MASTITAQEIVDDCEEILQDTANDRWEESELLQWFNNGTKEICLSKPDTYIVSESMCLAAGVVQDLPAGGFQLQEITCNMGVAPGTTPGKAIRLLDREVLDAMDENWPSATASAVVDYYAYDPRDPLRFLVSPPQPAIGFGYVQIFYPKAPAEIAIGDTILIPDIYRSVLMDYILYRAYSKDADQASNARRALAYRQAFNDSLGIRQQMEATEDPNAN